MSTTPPTSQGPRLPQLRDQQEVRSATPLIAALGALALVLAIIFGTRLFGTDHRAECDKQYTTWIRDARLLVTGTLRAEEVAGVDTQTPCVRGDAPTMIITLKKASSCPPAAAGMTKMIADDTLGYFRDYPGTTATCQDTVLRVVSPPKQKK